MLIKAIKGEQGEPYVAIRVLGDGKLYIADSEGNKNLSEWMEVLAHYALKEMRLSRIRIKTVIQSFLQQMKDMVFMLKYTRKEINIIID